MVGNVLLYFSLLASALSLKTPMPAYLPPAAEARLALVRKLRSLEVVRRRIVRGGSEGLLYLGYALTMKVRTCRGWCLRGPRADFPSGTTCCSCRTLSHNLTCSAPPSSVCSASSVSSGCAHPRATRSWLTACCPRDPLQAEQVAQTSLKRSSPCTTIRPTVPTAARMIRARTGSGAEALYTGHFLAY